MGEVNFPFSKEQAKVVSVGLESVISNIVRPVEYKDISGYAPPPPPPRIFYFPNWQF